MQCSKHQLTARACGLGLLIGAALSSAIAAAQVGSAAASDLGAPADGGTARPLAPGGTAPDGRPGQPSSDGTRSDDADAGVAGRAQAAPPPSWTPKLKATVKPAIAALGDPIAITIETTYRKGISVNLPLKLELGPFSELSRHESQRELTRSTDGAPTAATAHKRTDEQQMPLVAHRFTIKVAAYELGQLELPALSLTAVGPGGELATLQTSPIPVTIRSLMRNEPSPKLKDLEPPVSVYQPRRWPLYAAAGLLAAALIVIVTLWVSRRMRNRAKQHKPAPPPIPADVIALERLGQIDVEQMVADEQYKALYLLLSEIVRGYVGGRFQFDALEMTTPEIDAVLSSRGVDPESRRRLHGYFDACDLVKFAKYRPDADSARAAVHEARAIVVQTRASGATVAAVDPSATVAPQAAQSSAETATTSDPDPRAQQEPPQ